MMYVLKIPLFLHAKFIKVTKEVNRICFLRKARIPFSLWRPVFPYKLLGYNL